MKYIFILVVALISTNIRAQEMQYGVSIGPAQMFYDQLVNDEGTGSPSIRFNNKLNFSADFQYYYTLRENLYLRSGLHLIYAPYLQTQVATSSYSSMYPNNGEAGNISVFFFSIPAMLSYEVPINDNSVMISLGIEKTYVSEKFFQDPGSAFYPGINFRAGAMYLYYKSENFQFSVEPWAKYFLFTPEYTKGSLFSIGIQCGVRFNPYADK